MIASSATVSTDFTILVLYFRIMLMDYIDLWTRGQGLKRIPHTACCHFVALTCNVTTKKERKNSSVYMQQC